MERGLWVNWSIAFIDKYYRKVCIMECVGVFTKYTLWETIMSNEQWLMIPETGYAVSEV